MFAGIPSFENWVPMWARERAPGASAVLGERGGGGGVKGTAVSQLPASARAAEQNQNLQKSASVRDITPVSKRGVEPSVGQCSLRTLGVTGRPRVPECGRAPGYWSRELASKSDLRSGLSTGGGHKR